MRVLGGKSNVPGAPAGKVVGQHATYRQKVMAPIRSIRTLIAKDESKGVTQPEFRNTLQRAGVGSRQSAPSIKRQTPETPPSFGTRPGKTVSKASDGPLSRR